jgi:AraC-like DNA-binding protein
LAAPLIDQPRYWRNALLPGGELLTAQLQRHVFARHWHETYVVPVILAGAQTYYYRHAQRSVGPGGIAVINPGEVHTGERGVDVGWAYRAFYVPATFLCGLAEQMADRSVRQVWFPDGPLYDAELSGRLVRVHRALQHGIDMLSVEAELIDAFQLLLSRYGGVREQRTHSARDPKRVGAMQETLREHLNEPLSLTELARAVGLSAHHAAQLFAREVGMPPHAWRNQVRLEHAVRLLRSRMSVAEVAASCGYTDQSHFTRHFRKAYGVPPGRWQAA